jgi:hypothetical protein
VQAILLSREEVGRRAKEIYENSIRQQVYTEQNIGKMVIIDIETGEYAVDEMGIESAHLLRKKTHTLGFSVFASVTRLLFPSVVRWSAINSDFWYY